MAASVVIIGLREGEFAKNSARVSSCFFDGVDAVSLSPKIDDSRVEDTISG